MSAPLKIVAGTTLTFDVMEWREPYWEFDHPSAILAPVVRAYEDARDIEQTLEDVCIDACVDGQLVSSDLLNGRINGRWKLSTLQRAFRAAVARGEPSGRLQYQAERITVRFYNDENGDLASEIVDGSATERREVTP